MSHSIVGRACHCPRCRGKMVFNIRDNDTGRMENNWWEFGVTAAIASHQDKENQLARYACRT